MIMMLRTPSGAPVQLIVEAKSLLRPDTLAQLEQQLAARGLGSEALVVAPYLSPAARRQLANRGLSFADATGNVRIAIDDPPFFIELAGAERAPQSDEQPLRSLKGRGSARALRALCDFAPPFRLRPLAERAGTNLAMLSRVLAILEGEQLVTRDDAGSVVNLPVSGVVRRWAQDYEFGRANTVRTFLDPRGVRSTLDKLRQAPFRYALTGSAGANLVAPIAPARMATVYVESFTAAAALGIREAGSGSNVLLAVPFDDVVFERTIVRDGIVVVSPPQLAADLLTGPGRSPAEGDQVLTWLEANTEVWRARL